MFVLDVKSHQILYWLHNKCRREVKGGPCQPNAEKSRTPKAMVGEVQVMGERQRERMTGICLSLSCSCFTFKIKLASKVYVRSSSADALALH